MIDQMNQLMYQTMQQMPEACAHITGSSEIHNLVGDVYVYPFLEGSLLVVDVEGIPFSGFYGFHIHQHGPCITGEGYTGFQNVGGHFTTVENAPHPYHAGDLPSLMALTAMRTWCFTQIALNRIRSWAERLSSMNGLMISGPSPAATRASRSDAARFIHARDTSEPGTRFSRKPERSQGPSRKRLPGSGPELLRSRLIPANFIYFISWQTAEKGG